MELSSMIKTIFKQLKIVYFIFLGFWILTAIIPLFFVYPLDKTFSLTTMSLLFLSSLIFVFSIGKNIYGNYGKTFMFIQNNRIFFIICSLIIGILTTISVTLLDTFMRFSLYVSKQKISISKPEFMLSLNSNIIIMTFLAFLTVFTFGALYGLFVKYNKKAKKIIIPLFAFIIIGLSFVINPINFKTIETIFNYNIDQTLLYLILLIIFNITSLTVCSIYYCKLDILKVYSAE